MNRVRLVVIAMLTAVMACSIAVPANASGGGRYSVNHPDSRYTVNFKDNGWPGDRFSDPRPPMSQWTPPGRNAVGLHYVDWVWSPKPGYMQCNNDKYRISIPAETWTRACRGDARMVVVIR